MQPIPTRVREILASAFRGEEVGTFQFTEIESIEHLAECLEANAVTLRRIAGKMNIAARELRRRHDPETL